VVLLTVSTFRGAEPAWAGRVEADVAPDAPMALVLDREFPDPGVLQVDTTYFLYGTGSNGRNVQVGRTDDLVHWTELADALPALPVWAEAGFTWAPAVTRVESDPEYVLYFVARDRASGHQCIGLATSNTPEGPFDSPSAEPLVCQVDLGGSIDPSVFVDDQQRFLLWKNDAWCCGLEPWLWIQPLSDDGQSLLGTPAPLLHPDQPWEGGVVEAPTLVKRQGSYYLFYSANDYAGAQYAIGYARAPELLGPYRKARGPLLRTSESLADVIGPGGQDILQQGERTWLVYHAWDPTLTYRYLRLDRLTWKGATPVLQRQVVQVH
jgi:beta-xylosidase